jgi:acetyltransferase-like isoleucine patch superfamily enzyme
MATDVKGFPMAHGAGARKLRDQMRYETKRLIVYCMYLLVWPFGLPSWLAYTLWGSEKAFDFSAKLLSLIPGKVGQYVRAAFYKMTLAECYCDLMVGFCSYFSHPTARVGRHVGMGSFSTVGTAVIGDNVMIASRASILSGKNQHGSALHGAAPSYELNFETVTIGDECWIGEGAIVMASLGRQCMVSAGSVVTKPAPDRAVAVGNPARFLKRTEDVADADS